MKYKTEVMLNFASTIKNVSTVRKLKKYAPFAVDSSRNDRVLMS